MVYVFLGKYYPCSTMLVCSILANVANRLGCKSVARKIAVFAWNVADYAKHAELYWLLQNKLSPWFDFYDQ